MACSTFFQFCSLLICETAYFNLLRSAKRRHDTNHRILGLIDDALNEIRKFRNLKEAAKCVDIIPSTLLASISSLRTLVQIQNGNDIWPNLRRLIVKFMKIQATKTWKELTTGVQQLVRLLFNNNFTNPGLVL